MEISTDCQFLINFRNNNKIEAPESAKLNISE